jgi:hypothetical protein
MKKATLCILAAGALVFMALPVNAQKKVTLQEVQKETQKAQTIQGAATTATPQAAVKPNAAASTSAGAVTGNPGTPNQPVPAPAPEAPVPLTCTWDVTDFDFGKTIIQNKPANATFTLTNAGKDPITITLVQPSCGCTSPKYTKEPIKPGGKGEVVLTYNAAVSGYFSKSAQVKLNDGQKYSLTIKGEVQKVEPEATPVTTTPIK